MVDRRRHPRHSAALLRNWRFAQIVSLDGQSIDCTIENLSWGGACLLVSNTTALPDTFDLIVKDYGVREHCRTVWRSGRALGVSFREAGESKQAETHHHRTILGSERVRQLLTFKLGSSLKRLPSWRRLTRLIG